MLVCAAAGLLACGQKGPLLLPDAPKHKRLAPKPPATPAAAKPAGGVASPAPAEEGAGTGAATGVGPGTTTGPGSGSAAPSNPSAPSQP